MNDIHFPDRSRPRLSRAARLLAGLALALVLVLAVALAPAAAQDAVLVIVNEANPVSTLTTREVSDLFLKKAGTFSDGTKAVPVDLGERSEVRGAFSRWVHRKTTSAIKAFWQQMIFSGRGVPPPEKSSTADVMAFVRGQRGGIGYVAQGTPLSPGVKAVTVQ
jgi:ABC-type phosphate transport system substrate-binding protein